MNKENQAAFCQCNVSSALPHYLYVVYSGSEKLDLGDKSPIAICRYKADAELLLTKFYPYGYIEEMSGNDC